MTDNHHHEEPIVILRIHHSWSFCKIPFHYVKAITVLFLLLSLTLVHRPSRLLVESMDSVFLILAVTFWLLRVGLLLLQLLHLRYK